MNLSFESGRTKLPTEAVRSYVRDLSATLKISQEKIVSDAKIDPNILTTKKVEIDAEPFWRIARVAYENKLIDLIPANGLPSVNYDLNKEILLPRAPYGPRADFSQLILEEEKTNILGHMVDYPLGVPASILTANASYIKYYADRGFPILTYKTVRSRAHEGNPFPQWVCLDNPPEFQADESGELLKPPPNFVGKTNFFPPDPDVGSMANSFGVPSHDPTWWKHDLQDARNYVREGHQLLIVSVMSSIVGDELALLKDDPQKLARIADDFAQTAVMAREAGADVIELNYSCPNTKGTNVAGLIYQAPADAAVVSRRVRDALGPDMPIITKIGYLGDAKLTEFVHLNFPFIDGVVAINTISAPVVDASREPVFPSRQDNTAGISGWSVRRVAQRMAIRLVHVRDELAKREGKRLVIFGLGGIMTRMDFIERRKTGVDVVEICTGAYFNQFLGLEIRRANGKVPVLVQHGMISRPQVAAAGALGRSAKPGAKKLSVEGEKAVPKTRKRASGAHGAIDPAVLRKAFDEYFEETSPDEVIEGLNERSPELLVYLVKKGTDS